MSIQQAEVLKREWTDQFVTVRMGVPELRRFEKFVGQVRTVNMNGRALVEFAGSADIGWYDIDPRFLVRAESASRKGPVAVSGDPGSATGKPPTVPKASAATPENTPVSGGSPLDQIRAQSGGSSVAPAASPKSPEETHAATFGKAASPLDQIRSQAGVKTYADSSSSSSPEIKLRAASTTKAAPDSPKAGRTIFDGGAPPPPPLEMAPPETAANIPSPYQLLGRQGFQVDAAQNTDNARSTDASSADMPTTFRGKKLPRKDDLAIIEGIGPKIAELLGAAGIKTWKVLSETDPAKIKEILTAAGSQYKMHDPNTWPNQAQLADEGLWNELEEYQDILDGGRET